MSAGIERRRTRSGASLALDNLRAVVVLLVLSFHSALAYLAFLPPRPYPFDAAPYYWAAIPVVDPQRWLGFDIFCAWQDVFLMTLFFCLSGLFVWPSLARRGPGRFLRERALRLGVPFAVVVAFLMPVAAYPSYLQSAADPSFTGFWGHFSRLPFWPSGPMWFLWLLLAGDAAAAGLYRLMPGSSARLAAALSRQGAAAARLCGLLFAAALAYVPLALLFTPMRWAMLGPFSLQLSRPIYYAVWFFAGIGFGAGGVERELFAAEGPLVRRWPWWLAAAAATMGLWMGMTDLTMRLAGKAPLALQAADDLSFVLASFANVFCVLGLALRFARGRWHLFDSLKANAYGMYLVHYPFVVWLQYGLLAVALPAIAKAGCVFTGVVLLSWGTAAALRRAPAIASILGAQATRGAAVRPS
jgi:glucan biosynthesis protein C